MMFVERYMIRHWFVQAVALETLYLFATFASSKFFESERLEIAPTSPLSPHNHLVLFLYPLCCPLLSLIVMIHELTIPFMTSSFFPLTGQVIALA